MSTLTTPFSSPASDEYVAATAAYNLLANLRPSGALVATSTAEVIAAVKSAARQGRQLSVITTGHAARGMAPLDGTLLLRVAFDTPVVVDAEHRVATIPAGAVWGDVVSLAAEHGLAVAHGSSATVGAIGYLLRGGLSFYGRLRGVASNSLRSVTIVTADGSLVKADAQTEPDLFWAVRGGGGGFGIVVEVEIDLFPVWNIITGFVAWNVADADRIAPLWRDWTESAPNEVTTSLRLMNLPPLPEIPEPLKNGQILVLDGAVTIQTREDLAFGADLAESLLEPLREAVTPIMDTWRLGTVRDLPATHMDPPDPMPFLTDHFLLERFDDRALGAWLDAGTDTVLAAAELRQLGGAFATGSPDGGALNSIGGEFAAFNAGVTAGPATPEVVVAHQRRIREALGAYDTGFTAPTFVEERDSRHRAFPAEVEARVESIRARFDPTGLFERDVTRATV